MYAIVDIETTGSYAAANGITEIAIVFHDGEKVTGAFQTLINPKQHIPRFIESMTGITNSMVEDAPSFEDMASEIHALLNDKIFVAHNVNFDYSFVRHQLKVHGYELNSKKLCTVRLSKKVYPGLKKYGLGYLCRHFEIENTARHRALGDAQATAEIFSLLMQNNAQPAIDEMLKSNSKEQMLPPHLPREQFLQLPSNPGVYYFHNDKGKVIYVGKAKNLKARVSSHFANNNPGRQKQNFLQNIFAISFDVCSTEFVSMILESAEIKRLWPEFNRSQKGFEAVYGIFDYEDQSGFIRLSIDRVKKHTEPVEIFHFINDATNTLWKLVNEFELCPKKCGLQNSTSECGREGNCICEDTDAFKNTYNQRVANAIEKLNAMKQTFAIADRGRTADEKTLILVEKGKFSGYGYIPDSEQIQSLDDLKNYIRPLKENFYIRYLIARFAEEHPAKVVYFNQ